MVQIELGKKSLMANAILVQTAAEGGFEGVEISTNEMEGLKRFFEAKRNIQRIIGEGDKYFVNIEKVETPYLQVEKARVAGYLFSNELKALKIEEVSVSCSYFNDSHLLAFVEGMAIGSYQYNRYKSKPAEYQLKTIRIIGGKVSKNDVLELNTMIESLFLTRDLVNTPVIGLNASQFSEEIKKAGKKAGFKTEIFNKAKIEALKMGGLLGVNLGSIDEPTFNIMEYKPKGAVNKHPLVLVGKGVVYDTGGLSLKTPSTNMETMKCDMAGGAAVVGILHLVAKLQLPVYIVGLIPATDNRLNNNAVAPGDVITMSDGTTVEVLNTDAEGRLILADALHYAKKYNPEMVFDFATLTGAAQRAIGHQASVFMGTVSEEIKSSLKNSGYNVFERLVEFPIWDDYADALKSDIADLKNITGGASSGAITAGKFLQHFTDYPWVHFDIAGTAFNTFADAYRSPNASGVGVRLIYDFIKNTYLNK